MDPAARALDVASVVLLIWQMGIWVECDGWYRRAPLLFSYDVTNPPDPRLLVSVAQDLVKRMDLAGFGRADGTGPLVLVHNDLAAKVPGVQGATATDHDQA